MPSMAYRIRYRPRAVTQLDAIAGYLGDKHPAAAKRVVQRIKKSIERLARLPYSSRQTEIEGIRVLAVVRYPYLVFYSVDEEAREVHVLRIRHSSQNPERHLTDI